jgi:hypothetical protein
VLDKTVVPVWRAIVSIKAGFLAIAPEPFDSLLHEILLKHMASAL